MWWNQVSLRYLIYNQRKDKMDEYNRAPINKKKAYQKYLQQKKQGRPKKLLDQQESN